MCNVILMELSPRKQYSTGGNKSFEPLGNLVSREVIMQRLIVYKTSIAVSQNVFSY